VTPKRGRLLASRISRAACASVRTGTGPLLAAIPPSASLVMSAVRAPSRAARSAATSPAGPAPMTRDIEAVMALRRHHSSVAREVDNAEVVKPVECELDGKRGQKEPEDLFGHEHPAGVEVVAHSVRPPKHDHVKSDYHQEHP